MNKKLSLEIEPELHKKLKRLALERETSIRAILIAAINRELAQPTATQDTRTDYAADGDG